MRKTYLTLPLLIGLFLAGCASSNKSLFRDPFYDSFFEKARLIMSHEEVEIYKHLPDVESKRQFIEEFWQKRDPNPETEVNENKVEFERRIEYANRWFRENRAMGRGWDTPRGRILLQLGEPDNRELHDQQAEGRKAYELWYYLRLQLYLEFVDMEGFGEFKLYNWPATLVTALELTKFTLNLVDSETLKRTLLFDASYKGGQINIEIPVKRINFKEEGDNAQARFKVLIYVFRDYRQKEKLDLIKEINESKAAILGRKTLTFAIPYEIKEPGKHVFDIIIEDTLGKGKARKFLNAK